jgi:hypothetical protein
LEEANYSFFLKGGRTSGACSKGLYRSVIVPLLEIV